MSGTAFLTIQGVAVEWINTSLDGALSIQLTLQDNDCLWNSDDQQPAHFSGSRSIGKPLHWGGSHIPEGIRSFLISDSESCSLQAVINGTESALTLQFSGSHIHNGSTKRAGGFRDFGFDDSSGVKISIRLESKSLISSEIERRSEFARRRITQGSSLQKQAMNLSKTIDLIIPSERSESLVPEILSVSTLCFELTLGISKLALRTFSQDNLGATNVGRSEVEHLIRNTVNLLTFIGGLRPGGDALSGNLFIILRFLKSFLRQLQFEASYLNEPGGFYKGSDALGVNQLSQECEALAEGISQALQRDPSSKTAPHKALEFDLAKADTILSWLSRLDSKLRQNMQRPLREVEIVPSLLRSPEYARWIEGEEQHLWCAGHDGVGKSMAASLIIDKLTEICSGRPQTCLLYLHCSASHQGLQNAEDLIGDLWRQVLRQIQPLNSPGLRECFYRHFRVGGRPSFTEMVAHFSNDVKSFSKLLIVLDGLDVLEEVEQRRLITSLQSAHMFAQLLVFSRPDQNILGFAGNFTRHDVVVRDSDLAMFIDHFASSLSSPSDGGSENDIPYDTIKRVLIEKSDRNFLLLRMHIDRLQADLATSDLELLLDQLPNNLHDALRQNVERILSYSEEESVLALNTLRWVAFSFVPLTQTQLTHVVIIKERNGKFITGDGGKPIAWKRLLQLCRGSLAMLKRHYIVYLSHDAIYDYLRWYLLQHFKISPHWHIGGACMASLIQRETDINRAHDIALDQLRFYAANWWGHHAQIGCSDDQILGFLKSSKNDSILLSSPYQRHNLPDTVDRKQTWPLLHMAVDLGRVAILDKLIRKKTTDVNETDTFQRTALGFAVLRDRVPCMKLLLTLDWVNVNAKDVQGRSALLIATRLGRIEAIKLLLQKKNVNIASQDLVGRTPLSYASEMGDIDVLRLLLSCNGDLHNVNRVDVSGRTPLSYAAANGHAEVVRELLQVEGIDFQLPDRTRRSPIFHALFRNHAKVVNMLLTKENPSQATAMEVDVSGRRIYDTPSTLVKFVASRENLNQKDLYGRSTISHMASDYELTESLRLLLSIYEGQGDEPDLEGRTPFSYAAQSDNLVAAMLLLEQGEANPDAPDQQGRTPMSYAVEAGSLSIVRFLTTLPARVAFDTFDTLGRTPLSYAAGAGEEDCFKILMALGANLSQKDRNNRSALSYASEGGDWRIVWYMLRKPEIVAQIDEVDSAWRSPVSYAAAKGRKAVLAELFARRENLIDRPDQFGRTALSYAAEGGHSQVVQWLLGKVQVWGDRQDISGRKAISYAAQKGDVATVKALRQTKFETPDLTGRTPLHYAIGNPNKQLIVKALLSFPGIEPDFTDKEGRTPLWYAVDAGDGEIAKLLLSNPRVDPNRKYNSGRTLLSLMAEQNRRSIVGLLLQYDLTEVDSSDDEGRTPLSYAAEHGQVEVVKLLLGKGADCTSSDEDRRNSLSYAAGQGHVEIMECLLETKGNQLLVPDLLGRSVLSHAVENGHSDAAQLILWHDPEAVSGMDMTERSIISYAAKSGNGKLFRFLLDMHEAATDLADQNGRTPLIHAATHGKEGVMRILLARDDVDVNRKDRRGRGALAYAAQRGHAKVVELLLDRSVNPNERDLDGRTPISLAAERGRVAVVHFLLQQPIPIDISADVAGKTPKDHATEQRRLWDEVLYGDHWEAYDEILLALDRYQLLSAS